MRKVISVIAMLLGAAALVVGIGQKTFWAPPETVTATMPQLDGEAPLTVIESSVNDPKLDPVELVIKAKGEFTASLGRSYDVDAWVDNAAHVSLTGVDTENHQMIAKYVDGEAEVPNPAGDDIFFDSQSADGTMTYRWTTPDSGDWSLLLAAGGKDAAPVDISVTYANDDAMPFALPLIIAGAVLLVFGLALLVMRPAKPKNSANTQHSVAAAAVVALAISGVALPMQPQDDSSATPSESASPSDEASSSASSSAPAEESASASATESASESSETSDAEPTAYPVLTEEQLKNVLADVQKQVGNADDKQDAKALESRAAGAFKYLRGQRYEMLKKDYKVDKPLTLNTQVLRSAAVPNASGAEFPRVISVVTAKDNDADTLPQAMTLVQKSARDNYQVVFAGQMLPNSSFPGIAVGDPATKQLTADAKDLQMTPEKALDALADVLTNENSKQKDKFADSEFIKAIHAAQKSESDDADEAKVSYKRSVTKGDTYAVSTPDGGAIVVGKLNNKALFERTENADPLKSSDKLTEQLLGSNSSNGNVESTYAEPVMFYIPADGSEDKIQLISADQVLLAVKEVD